MKQLLAAVSLLLPLVGGCTLQIRTDIDLCAFTRSFAYDLDAAAVNALRVNARSGHQDTGPVTIAENGSGELEILDVKGAVALGEGGSGRLDLQRIGGPVTIETRGSGDIAISEVEGSVRVGSAGSGGMDVRNVTGDLTVASKGSGNITYDGVTGRVELPPR